MTIIREAHEYIFGGDKVELYLIGSRTPIACTVLHMPSQVDPCWHVVDDQGNLRYVQQFEEIVKVGVRVDKPANMNVEVEEG